ncbi:hypothetical protein D3C78_614360 [compost metagenome]
MIRAGVLLAAAAGLTGCDDFNGPPPKLQRAVSTITVRVDPDLRSPGWADWKGDACRIILREYPLCLAHEVRHCFEGDWHAGHRTGEDC